MSTKGYDLQRFINAQEYNYDLALSEIRNGKKLSHWIWYIFPQIAGLGRSSMCATYGIKGLEEAKAYLSHPILKQRLEEISLALLELPSNNPVIVMGRPDDKKLCSCMTLFLEADPSNKIFSKVLDKYFDGKKDNATIKILNQNTEK